MEFKRSKNSRQRGSSSHGWGAKKKHRGAGHRGGRGAAGSGKRGDAKKPSYWTDMKRYGKHGFTKKNQEKITTVNIAELDSKINTLLAKNKIQLNKDIYVINLNNIKVNKLLGAGKTTNKFEITVTYASELAIKKITEAGGKVILPEIKEKKVTPEPKTKKITTSESNNSE